jgi:hypothetical protein
MQSVYKKVRIAVLMYGHVRTGAYCAPYIKKWFEVPKGTEVILYKQRIHNDDEILPPVACEVEVDYFLDLKDRNTYTNTIGDTPNVPLNLSTAHLQEMLDLFQPKGYHVTNYEQELDWQRDENNLAKYSTMFNSIYTCLRLKQEYELNSGIRYDFCFTHRYDAINGPDINAFRNRISTLGFPPLTIVNSYPGVKRWPWEQWRMGPNDVFFGGDSLAVEMLMADLSRVFLVNKNLYHTSDELGGPNVMIGRSLANTGLVLTTDHNFITAIVRPKANLKLDVFDSWQYHQNFWIQNHSSNATEEKLIE